MVLSLTRSVRFRARHRLHNPEWSLEENRRRFGWTTESHGHHYSCAVTVTGPVDERLAMVIDLAAFDRILNEEILARFDGKSLDQDVPEYRTVLPTCEAIARDLFRRIASRLPEGVRLVRIRVAEDATLHADCCGDA
jgi:6-pyruvoyltetrahydropterin/6-carboxytetrahydropterin synthase